MEVKKQECAKNRNLVMIVADNEQNRTMIREMLAPQYELLEACEGQEALSLLYTHAECVDLIVLMLAKADESALIQHIHRELSFAEMPILVITAANDPAAEEDTLRSGAADAVRMPCSGDVLRMRVHNLIRLYERAAEHTTRQLDSLTNIYSRKTFFAAIRQMLDANLDRTYDLICSDVRRFKMVNDRFGEKVGDAVLQGMAKLYQQHLGKDGICGRIGADRFACVIPRLPQDDCRKMLMDLENEITQLMPEANLMLHWGIYPIEDRKISVELMCDRAFLAARSIQDQYTQHVAVYDEALRDKMLEEQRITESMKNALLEGQFELYLQPKYRVRDGALSSSEALVRWNHPEHGIQPPDKFIPLFERNGFITMLDRFVWERACKLLARWDKKGYPPIPVSVNVSRSDIYSVDIEKILTDLVQEYGLDPARLHLEITESAYTENTDQILETVRRLRDLGFIIEMDDFGSGYSSLNMLNRMPVDILKLDMKFVQEKNLHSGSREIINFIIELAVSMGMSVVAEGVETSEQMEQLRQAGCNYVQGYYFARPMPVKEFERVMQADGTPIEPRQEDVPQVGRRPDRLLVVSEDAAYRAAVRETFMPYYIVQETVDVGGALDEISMHERQTAAVVLSLSVPGDGFRLLDILRKKRKAWNVPVVAVGSAAQEEQALSMGADDFLSMPHAQKLLWWRVQRVVEVALLREREHVLMDAAYQDYATGLLNRRGLNASVALLVQQDAPAAVYLLTLRNLHTLYKKEGHAAGDAMLYQFTQYLREHTRKNDVLARTGSEEFVVILKRMDQNNSVLLKEREFCAFDGGDSGVYCAAGCAVWKMNMEMIDVFNTANGALIRNNGCCMDQNKNNESISAAENKV